MYFARISGLFFYSTRGILGDYEVKLCLTCADSQEDKKKFNQNYGLECFNEQQHEQSMLCGCIAEYVRPREAVEVE